jgi:hypothetical protein
MLLIGFELDNTLGRTLVGGFRVDAAVDKRDLSSTTLSKSAPSVLIDA